VRRAHAILALFGAAALALSPARAEDLVSVLSKDLIEIRSNFTGTDIVLFGAIESPDPFASAEGRDIVVAIRGPDAPATVRRKARIAGVWINRDSVTFDRLPGFYFVAATRPLGDIASPLILQRFELGLANLAARPLADTEDSAAAAEFLGAAIRQKREEGLYEETTSGIEFSSHSVFRARVPLPATVPPGSYTADVYLFRDGTVISAQSTPLYVDKSGMERRLYNLAHREPLFYGIGAVLMALLLGWMSSILFRQS